MTCWDLLERLEALRQAITEGDPAAELLVRLGDIRGLVAESILRGRSCGARVLPASTEFEQARDLVAAMHGTVFRDSGARADWLVQNIAVLLHRASYRSGHRSGHRSGEAGRDPGRDPGRDSGRDSGGMIPVRGRRPGKRIW